MLRSPKLDSSSEIPLYRQLYDFMRSEIEAGYLAHGDRLPATREFSVQIGLNRTTVSAAYGLLESEGWIRGHVGRGSFVAYAAPAKAASLPALISFASSRPDGAEFPIADFQATTREILGSTELTNILQLGSPFGYAPLRSHLLEESRREGTAGEDDDILITSGCQQALDLIQRVLAPAGSTVAIESPVYHGQKNVFARDGVHLVPMAIDRPKLDLSRALREQPAVAVVTPNFQNPTGETLSLEARQELLAAFGCPIVENDIYGSLRYHGQPVSTLKQLDRRERVLLIRSYSKIAFPGLRVGWVIGPRELIARLADAKQWCDLHTDQLAQAILLRFSETGRLAEHHKRVLALGQQRLEAVLEACAGMLPSGCTWTKPEGGMSLWLRLPDPLDASELLAEAERAGVSYLPGRHFSVSGNDGACLRLSFGGLPPERITEGVARLAAVCRNALQSHRAMAIPALV